MEAGNLTSEVLAAVFGRDVKPTGVLFIETDAPLLDGEGWTGQLVSCAGCGEVRRCATAVRCSTCALAALLQRATAVR